MTTSITDVVTLRTEAATHGDDATVADCDLIIEAGELQMAETPEVAAAWDRVEAILADARAQN